MVTMLCFLTASPGINSFLQAQPAMPGFYGKSENRPVPPSSGALPVLKNHDDENSFVEVEEKHLEVHQNGEKTVLNWRSFDIGDEASVHFDQKGNPDWAALNRIYDQNPSQIFGKLTADGRIYLVNQNGIVFGPDSQVNSHAVTASALNLKNEDFIDNQLKYRFENYMGGKSPDTSEIYVSNHGEITAKEGGSVFLIGPNVENNGTISAPTGQIGLVAGTDVELVTPQLENPQSTRVAKTVKINQTPGGAVNFEQGSLTSVSGTIGMYGQVVNQEGLIRSVSAVKREGQIELVATHEIQTGAKSVTECPVSSSTEAVNASFVPVSGKISLTVKGEAKEGETEKTPDRIIHQGKIRAEHGYVRLEAPDRIYLDQDSSIDVSGSWVDQDMKVNQVFATLNSMELRDEFGQKDEDSLLKGEEITFTTQEGSAIGDMEGALNIRELTAAETSTQGGVIQLFAHDGDVIVREGAEIDISGGGFNYGSGSIETTHLVSGTTIYDISDAPQWVEYDAILGNFSKSYHGFGEVETYSGHYYGGPAPMYNYISGYIEGSDAGKFEIQSRNLILDGHVAAGTVVGPYQNYLGADEPEDELGNQLQKGRRVPKSGTLVVGYPDDNKLDSEYVTEEIVVQKNVEKLPEDFSMEDDPDFYADMSDGFYQTFLSSDGLNEMELSSILLYANHRLIVEADVDLNLKPGGNFYSRVRSIDYGGKITIPSGTVTLSASGFWKNTEEALPYIERLFLDSESLIDVSGERVDNSYIDLLEDKTYAFGQENGGSVTLEDKHGEGVVVLKEAVIDASGGYVISAEGKVKGGDAGTIALSGTSVVLDGEVRGHALADQEGGSLRIMTSGLQVVPWRSTLPDGFQYDDALPQGVRDILYLAEDQLSDTGMTNLSFFSGNDLVVEEGVSLQPSYVRLAEPIPGVFAGEESEKEATDLSPFALDALVTLSPDYLSGGSISLSAGSKPAQDKGGGEEKEDAMIHIKENGSVVVSAEGDISLTGPGIRMEGSLSAPGGDIAVTTKRPMDLSYLTTNELYLGGQSVIDVSGFNRLTEEPIYEGAPAQIEPVDGGDIRLTAAGSLVMEKGATLDLSGSPRVSSYVQGDKPALEAVDMASDPGALKITYGLFLNPVKDGEGHVIDDGQFHGVKIFAENHLAGYLVESRVREGQFVLDYKRDAEVTGTGRLEIDQTLLDYLVESGFEDVAFYSSTYLLFSGPVDLKLNEKLTLDAPEIRAILTSDEPEIDALADEGLDLKAVNFSAPWIVLSNTYRSFEAIPRYTEGSFIDPTALSFNLSARFIDLMGKMVFSGFDDMALKAENDLRMDWNSYLRNGADVMAGGLDLGKSDLLLSAARIYPMTQADITINTLGDISISKSGGGYNGPVVSAGGKLTLQGKNIDHQGVLAAPLGKITLAAIGTDETDGVVHLEAGSLVTTAVTGDVDQTAFKVNYGELTQDGVWVTRDPATSNITPLTEAPEKEVSIHGEAVIADEGSVIDISGGGSLFAYGFLPSLSGTQNPLEGCSVIMADNSVVLPGEAIYLTGGHGLAEGVYSLLPESYAFMDNALIVRDMKTDLYENEYAFSDEGLPVVAGYATEAGTGIVSTEFTGFSIERASDVIRNRGTFEKEERILGDGGSAGISAYETLLKGEIKAAALKVAEDADPFLGGKLLLSGKEVIIGDHVNEITDLSGKLILDTASFSGETLSELVIGDIINTDSVTIQASSGLSAGNVTFAAANEISLEREASIDALTGSVALTAPDGKITTGAGSSINAKESIILHGKETDLQGGLKAEGGSLELITQNMLITSEEKIVEKTMVIGEDLWKSFSGFDALSLTATAGIWFSGDVSIDGPESILMDTPLIDVASGMEQSVSMKAGKDLTLKNSGETIGEQVFSETETETSSSGDTSLSLSGESVFLGEGETSIATFDAITITGKNSITCVGQGEVATDGDLTLAASVVTTAASKDSDGEFLHAADFFIRVVDEGHLTIDPILGILDSPVSIGTGGNLSLEAGTITHNGMIESDSTNIGLYATEDIVLGKGDQAVLITSGLQGAALISNGSEYAPGGLITLESLNGQILLEEGTVVSVSAGEQGDAGGVALLAPTKGVTMEGNLSGEAQVNSVTGQEGCGGSFILDTAFLEDMEPIYALNGGFDALIDVRTRSGNIDLPEGKTLSADHIRLTADDGAIDIGGALTASTESGGGIVELFAGEDLNLTSALINAAAPGTEKGDGGDVLLSATRGRILFGEGAEVDLSPAGEGNKGTLTLRAPATDTSVEITLSGTVRGAHAIDILAVTTHEGFDQAQVKKESDAYMAKAAIDSSSMTLEGCDPDPIALGPSIEIRLADNYTLDQELNLDSLFDYTGEILFRSAADVTINAFITDNKEPGTSSWDIALIAGADLDSADFHQVSRTGGNLVIGDQKALYTTGGDIFFGSADDTTLGSPTVEGDGFVSLSPFSLGTVSGKIAGTVNGDLILEGGVIQTATGDIWMDVGGDIGLNKNSDFFGAIRTLGMHPRMEEDGAGALYWEYEGGGDILISAGGNIGPRRIDPLSGLPEYSFLNPLYWDKVTGVVDDEGLKTTYHWSANYEGSTTTQGIATLAGGNITIHSGKNFLSQCGAFGEGDLSIHAGGDVDGRFLVRKSDTSHVNAMGSVGGWSSSDMPIELFDSRLTVSAQGDIEIGSVHNTSFVRNDISTSQSWLLDYSLDAGITLDSALGDVLLTGKDDYFKPAFYLINLLPAYVKIEAGEDIRLTNAFLQAPSPTGGLFLSAGGSIDGGYAGAASRSIISMIDMAPEKIYGSHDVITEFKKPNNASLFNSEAFRGLHDVLSPYLSGGATVRMHAGEDILDLRLYVYCQADMEAERDIVDLYYFGQNAGVDQITRLVSGRDIVMNTPLINATATSEERGVIVGGPGELLVMAGNSIELGQSQGVQSTGNLYNMFLDPSGCRTLVSAGFSKPGDFSARAADLLFEQLRDTGKEYRELLVSGEKDAAEEKLSKIRESIIEPFFKDSETGEGVINMVDSQISAKGEKSDLFVLTSGKEDGSGVINVGRTTINKSNKTKNSGIYTSSGGDINLYAKNDMNVNESRVMSFRGGDITFWSDRGSIRAGQGARTAINVEAPKVVYNKQTGETTISFEPPSVGSGIRTLTYDPDGLEGPKPAPAFGDVTIFAPEGVVDAGEAGIAGRNVLLAATKVVNAQNIEIGGTGVGVPSSGVGISTLGSLSGDGGLNSTKEMVDQASDLGDAKDKMEAGRESLGEMIKPKWLKVDFMGYENVQDEQKEKKKENKKR